MTLVSLRAAAARGDHRALLPLAGGTGTSHIHPFGVTWRTCGLARLNA